MEYRGIQIPRHCNKVRESYYAVRTSPNGEEWIMTENEMKAWEGPIFWLSHFIILETGDCLDLSTTQLTGKPVIV